MNKINKTNETNETNKTNETNETGKTGKTKKTDELTITLDQTDPSVHRYILSGRVSIAEANELQFELEEAMRGGTSRFILNMRKVTFLSSSGIRVLLMFYKKANARYGSFHVESPSENVINVLGLTALDAMLL